MSTITGGAGRAADVTSAEPAGSRTSAQPLSGAPPTTDPATDTSVAEPGPPSRWGSARQQRAPRRRPLVRSIVIATTLGALVTAAAYAATWPSSGPTALGPGIVTVEVGIEHSRFDLGALRVREGTIVRFVVHNRDPIDHELVIGTEAVHRRHRIGSEGQHPPVPGEVSVAAGETALTFYEFDTPGTVAYACHLPGHEAYGMRGTIEVVNNQRL